MLNVTIVDDNLLESVESFNLTIALLTGDARIGDLDYTVISIIDNDGMHVYISVAIVMISGMLYSYHCGVRSTGIHCCRE